MAAGRPAFLSWSPRARPRSRLIRRIRSRKSWPHTRAARRWERPGKASACPRRDACIWRAAAHADRHFQSADAVRLWRQLAEMGDGLARFAPLLRAAGVLNRNGEGKRAWPLLEEALVGLRAARAPVLEATALGTLANVQRDSSRMDLAERAYEQALVIYRGLGDLRREGNMLDGLGNLYRETGRFKEAERVFKQALTAARRADHLRSEGIVLGNLANLYRDTGRPARAERAYRRSLAIHRQIGNRRSEGVALSNLAGLLLDLDRTLEAETAFHEALAIHRGVGNRRFQGVTLGNLATCARSAAFLLSKTHGGDRPHTPATGSSSYSTRHGGSASRNLRP